MACATERQRFLGVQRGQRRADGDADAVGDDLDAVQPGFGVLDRSEGVCEVLGKEIGRVRVRIAPSSRCSEGRLVIPRSTPLQFHEGAQSCCLIFIEPFTAAHNAKTSSSLTREPPTRLSRRLDRSAERSLWLAGWLGEGSQRRSGHDQEYPRSGMDPGDGGGLTGRDAQPYAAHISP